jgi:hypothetical protein
MILRARDHFDVLVSRRRGQARRRGGLASAGRSVLVLRARSRIGGRCWTRRMAGLDIPVELGGRFARRGERTHILLRQAGIGQSRPPVCSAPIRGRPPEAINSFAEAARRAGRMLDQDLSFERFTASACPRRPGPSARMMVEGFDAADPAREALDHRGMGRGGEQGAPSPGAGGYGALMDWLGRRVIARAEVCCSSNRCASCAGKRGSVRVKGTFSASPSPYAPRKP